MLGIVVGTICVISLGIILYAYIGFPVTLGFMVLLKRKFNKVRNYCNGIDLPVLQVIISCYNEADIIADRIKNVLNQEYPPDKLSVLIVSDCSTDGSDDIVQAIAMRDRRVRLFSTRPNHGKNMALNAAFDAGEYKGDILCFTDADSMFERCALVNAARFFSSSKVGLVGGQVSYWLNSNSANQAEGLFWRLENAIRYEEGKLGVLVSCPGQLILMRRELFQCIPAEVNTDFAMPLSVLGKGYKTKFAKNAVVRALFPPDQKSIISRRKRTIIRALSTVKTYKKILPLHIRYILFWHKTVRFYLLFAQFLFLASSILSCFIYEHPFWFMLLISQIMLYFFAGIGWILTRICLRLRFIHMPYQFTLQNAVALSAAISFLKGGRVSKWKPMR